MRTSSFAWFGIYIAIINSSIEQERETHDELVPSRRMGKRVHFSVQTSLVCQESKGIVTYIYVENFDVLAVLSHYIQRIGRSSEQGKEANMASQLDTITARRALLCLYFC